MKFASLLLLSAVAWAQPALPVLRYVTKLAGSDHDSVSAAATDPSGNVWVAGTTGSLDFPVTPGAFQPRAGGSSLVRLDGGKYSWSMSPAVTRPLAIAASLTQPGLLFAADANGLHKSTDGGDTWVTLDAFPSAHPATTMAADPGNAAILYAGNSDGLFKTVDGGATWTTLTPAQVQSGSPLLFQVVVDPVDSHTVMAAGYGANVYRSSDAGASWTQVFTGALQVSFDASRPGVAFLFDFRGNLFASTDHGATWIRRGTTASLYPYPGAAPFADPFHPGTLYAGVGGAIFRSPDDGATWSFLRNSGNTALFAADSSSQSLFTSLGTQWVRSNDGFATVQPVGPPATPQIIALAVGAGTVQGGPVRFYLATAAGSDAFIAKLDPSGNILYSSYLGGSAEDSATALTVDASGNVYVTGATSSTDFPVTKSAYLTQPPVAASVPFGISTGGTFVLKLAPNGSLVYSTYFTDGRTFPKAIAVNSAGEVYLTGLTHGGLPVTPGAAQGSLSPACAFLPCTIPIGTIGPVIQQPVSNVFFSHFSADGSTLIGSTYLGDSNREGDAIAVDPQGIAYIAGGGYISEMSADAKSLLASTRIDNTSLVALVLDGKNNIYVAGSATAGAYTSPGAFQPAAYANPSYPGDRSFYSAGDAYVAKLTQGLNIQYATFLAGESIDTATAIAVDQAGIATVVGHTASKSFPVQGAFQASFSPFTGFLTRVNADGTGLVFSTYVGDTRFFQAAAVTLDANGNAVFAGFTAPPGSSVLNGVVLPGTAEDVFVARVDAVAGAPVVMGSVTNAASNQGGAIAPGETITIGGQGFGADAQLMLDGTSLKPIASALGQITVTIPASYQQRVGGTASLQVQSGGAASNVMIVPVAAAAPGIFSADGTGTGQGYILNSDLTLNSPSNPTSEGSLVSIALTGVGITSHAGQSDSPALPVAVFIDGFYCTGYDARVLKIPGLPGDVFLITVFVPHPADLAVYNPNLVNYKMPPTVAVNVQIGSVLTPAGISLSVK